jgi:hypothetical protein
LIDFYLNKSKYRRYSVSRLCYHYPKVNDNTNFVKFLRSKEVTSNNYINLVEKSRLFKSIRCNRLANNQPTLQMCSMCSMKPSIHYFLCKDSCLICGYNAAFNFGPASLCLFHQLKGIPNGMFKCCKILKLLI